MKMLFSRWNNTPPSKDGDLLFQPFSWSSTHHLTTATASPRYSLFTLSKIKNLAASAQARSKHCFSRSYGACPLVPFSAPGAFGATRVAPVALDTNDAPRRSVVGGGERNRTDDLLLAKQALSQLSYTPKVLGGSPPKILGGDSGALAPREPHRAEQNTKPPTRCRAHAGVLLCTSRSRRNWRCACRGRHERRVPRRSVVVGQGGFEPPTSRLSSARSNQLSY